jgi:transmembrane sensor
MTALHELSPDEQNRLEEAAQWRSKLTSDPSLGSSAEFRQWCADPRNSKAHEAVEKAWFAIAAAHAAPEVLELRRQAVARLHEAGSQRRNRRRRVVGAAAAALVIGVGVAALYINRCWLTTSIYKTDIGERRIVALPDGSRISMDSATTIQVTYEQTARSITLERGRSRFDVAHDPNRPFTVTAGPKTVVAVGTSFDVERLQSSVLITLIQGQVVIKSAAELTTPASTLAEQPISLKPGEELVVASNVRPAVVAADPQVARAWESGRLLFRDEPLGDAVARVNRYTDHPISIDPSIASIRVSGVFNAGDVASFVSAVTSYFPVQATTTETNSILLQPRS